MFTIMFAAVTYNVITVSYRQRAIPNEIMGRVNSLFRLFGWGAIPLGMLAFGALVSAVEAPLGREAALRLPYAIGAGLYLCTLAYSARHIRIPDR